MLRIGNSGVARGGELADPAVVLCRLVRLAGVGSAPPYAPWASFLKTELSIKEYFHFIVGQEVLLSSSRSIQNNFLY